MVAKDLSRKELAVLARGENWAAVYNPSGATAHWHKKLTEQEGQGLFRGSRTVRLLGLTLLGRAKHTLRRKCSLIGRLDRSVSGISLLVGALGHLLGPKA